ncbi:hypothetical protein [Floridanema evergladense]|uniref:Uncharacterized protein n=1 Tax=Floridaenema evergladense BLCC-F167 TaxID=3153639 RepID=A0ABV4WD07_9CYAN
MNETDTDTLWKQHTINQIERMMQELDTREATFDRRIKFLILCTQILAISTGLFVSAIGFLVVGVLR